MNTDIDIDLIDRQQVLKLITHTPAMQIRNGRPSKHNSGVYVSAVPVDTVNQCAAIDYVTAEDRGYFKLDLLNVSVYSLIQSPQHYTDMLARQPNWSRLWLDLDWSKQLIHIGNYTALLASMRPDSIERMAAFISVIRPGKSHLQNRPWAEVFATVWDNDSSKGYTFKKSHAVSYAMLVALHMNLIDTPDQGN